MIYLGCQSRVYHTVFVGTLCNLCDFSNIDIIDFLEYAQYSSCNKQEGMSQHLLINTNWLCILSAKDCVNAVWWSPTRPHCQRCVPDITGSHYALVGFWICSPDSKHKDYLCIYQGSASFGASFLTIIYKGISQCIKEKYFGVHFQFCYLKITFKVKLASKAAFRGPDASLDTNINGLGQTMASIALWPYP